MRTPMQLTVSFEVALSWFIRSGTVALRIKTVVKAMAAHLEQIYKNAYLR